MATNIINARLGCPDVTVWADWAWQYDYGQILKVSGVDLPDAYEVHFSNQETGGVTITQIGNADGVTVPDELLLSGADIFVWIFLHAGLDDGETVYKIVIPVKDRPQPSDEEPTPVEHSEITQTIAALNAAVEEAEEARQAIEDMTVSAETLPEGSSATVTKTVEDGVVNLDFGIPKGDTGDRGETGVTPDFSIGDVSTLPAGSYATASITGTTEAPVLNLGIPQGQRGENGAPGQTGPTGATPNLTIGTVSTLPAGSDATATITGTPENPVLSLGIPKGDTGDVSQADLATALLNKADVITDTASGSIVSIPDGMASPVLGLDVDIEPIQAGTGDPSPDNIRPISGRSEVKVTRTGKNLVEDSLVGYNIIANGTFEQTSSFTMQIAKVKKDVQYTKTAGDDYFIGGYFTEKPTPNSATYNNSRIVELANTFTAPIDGYVVFRTASSYATPQLEVGTTASSYEPYNGQTVTIQLGQTVYGGTLDVTEGKLRINKAIADLTTGMTGGSAGSGYVWYKQLQNALTVPNSQIADIISEAYIPIRFNAVASNVNRIALRDNGVIYVNNGSQSVLPVGNVVYALATPVEVTLTAEELDIIHGDNNIWADNGDTTVEYRCDTKKYILKKIAEALNA